MRSPFDWHRGALSAQSLMPRFKVTDLATTMPKKQPLTEDMRLMVEHFAALGLIKRVPAAFRFGQENVIYIHPVLHAQLVKQAGDRFESAVMDGFGVHPGPRYGMNMASILGGAV